MDHSEFQKLYPLYTAYPVPREVWDTPEGERWTQHRISCPTCAVWVQQAEVEGRGARVEDYPCVHMAFHATYKCEEHPELFACSKAPILYSERFDEYTIGPRGGTGDQVLIQYCPWCGVALPESKRDAWFAALEARGIDPIKDDVPLKFMGKAWRET
jgi:hypothetical protein